MPNYLVQSHLSIIKYAPMIFLLSIIFFLLLGWLYGRYRIRTSKDVIVRDSLATAIFGLSALVLGFTFSSANDHFNQRINTASLEAASIERVYKSTKYLRPADQALVQKSLREILHTRLTTYEHVEVIDDLNRNLDVLATQLDNVNEEILSSIQKAPSANRDLAEKVLGTQLEDLIGSFHAGLLHSKSHPPAIIDQFLLVLLCVGALLSGYAMAVQKEEDWFLTILYVGLMGFALFVIFSLEFPNQLSSYDALNSELLKVQDIIGGAKGASPG